MGYGHYGQIGTPSTILMPFFGSYRLLLLLAIRYALYTIFDKYTLRSFVLFLLDYI